MYEDREFTATFSIEGEGGEKILKGDAIKSLSPPLIDLSPSCMSKIIEQLKETGPVTKIVLSQKENYVYDDEQAALLAELAILVQNIRQTSLGLPRFSQPEYARAMPGAVNFIQEVIGRQLTEDPIGAYVAIVREIRTWEIKIKDFLDYEGQIQEFIDLLKFLKERLDGLELIKRATPKLIGYNIGSRELYQRFFRPQIEPNFIYSRIVTNYPAKAVELDSYKVFDSEVIIFSVEGDVRPYYHIVPPEFDLDEEKYELLETAKQVISEHRPTKEEFVDPEKTRRIFTSIGRDLLLELASSKGIELNPEEKEKLAEILVRYTIGFGILEVLLDDPKVQDITINAPAPLNPVYVVHADFGECKTNITLTAREVENWASKLRIISGRPLDEANPVLDTSLDLTRSRARIAAIDRPLSPDGLAFSVRRHRNKPWTLPLFIENKMITPLAAGVLSFLIDGSRTFLIAGTRSSGKTSMLSAVMTEIMRTSRQVVIEDSVTGDSEMLVRKNGEWHRTTIGRLTDEMVEKYGSVLAFSGHELVPNVENIEVFAMNKEGRIRIAKPSSFIRHIVTKPVYKVKTRTGRELKVTGDHSLFKIGEDADIVEAKVKELEIGQRIAVPKALPLVNLPKEYINLLDKLLDKDKVFISGEKTEGVLINYFDKIKSFGFSRGYSKGNINEWRRKKFLPSKLVKDLLEFYPSLDFKGDFFKIGGSSIKKLPIKIILDNNFLTLLGLWIADGCYDRNSVIISCNDLDDRGVVSIVAKTFGLDVKMHSDGVSYMLNSKTLKFIMQDLLGLVGDAYTKRVPDWIYSLGIEQIAAFLKGIFSGDGCATDYEIKINLSSINLLKDLQTLLSIFAINLRTGKLIKRDKTYRAAISGLESLQNFSKYIGFLQEYKQKRLSVACDKVSTHDNSDTFELSSIVKNELVNVFETKFNTNDYIKRGNAVGRRKLASLIQTSSGSQQLVEKLNTLVNADVMWDEVVGIETIEGFNDYVYDFSVPECESFVCQNIVAHNTLEIPIAEFRKLGYDIQNMKVQAAITKIEAELSASQGIRTSLRLGDSSLIVGEVRSSIRGSEEVVIVDNGIMKRVKISELENKDLSNVYVPTIGSGLKVKLSKLTGFVKHPKRKKLLKVRTRTGREVTVTEDHSLFAPTKNFEIGPIECKNLKVGEQIAIPSHILCGFNDIESVDTFDYLPEFRVENFERDVRGAIDKLGWKEATRICNINCGDIYNYFRQNQKTNIPFASFEDLMKAAELPYDLSNLKVKRGTSLSLPAVIPVNQDFCRFLGYFVSEGYYSLVKGRGGRVVITNSNREISEDISKISENIFGISPKKRVVKGIGSSLQHILPCSPLASFISRLECGRTCYEKRVPPVIFGLSKEKIAAFLRGLFSGDGSFTSSKHAGNMIRYHSSSKKLVEDVSYLLLNFGIVARIYKAKRSQGIGRADAWILEFKDREMVKTFLDEIGFLGKRTEVFIQKWPHTKANYVRFEREILKKHLTKYPRKYRHLFRFLRCSKNYLKKVVLDPECVISEKLKAFALGDFFLDEVKEIEEINLDEPEYVYDLSVEPTENFIGGFGGIILHNTEATALYEAMRVGALANVVAGTIHGDSPYGVFDRVVNDLGVPRTSFKATDVIIVANPVKTASGLEKVRRVTQITEVRKFWERDPLAEQGFGNLLLYNPKKDILEPTDILLQGESEVIKQIAGNIRELAGNWDRVWENIQLRADAKEEIVKLSQKSKRPELLEAEFVILANDVLHKIMDRVTKEVGYADKNYVFKEYSDWLRSTVRKII